MIAVAFILFAILLVGWLIAPNGEIKVEPVKAAAPAIKMGEAAA